MPAISSSHGFAENVIKMPKGCMRLPCHPSSQKQTWWRL